MLAGADPVILDATCVAKELTLLAVRLKFSKSAIDQTCITDDDHIASLHAQWLDQVLAQGHGAVGPLGIFGTSISGTWLAAALGDKVEFFVDEDVNRIGRTQLGRPIFSPENAPRDQVILMPIRADIAAAVALRLVKHELRLTIPPEA